MKLLTKLSIVMFYASLPLFIPFFYSLYTGDGGYAAIGILIFLLAFLAIPEILKHLFSSARKIVNFIFRKETPWNYADLTHLETLKKEVERSTFGEVLVLTALAWIIIPVLGAIPYYMCGFVPVDALFESISGWTSTGLTTASTLDELPKSIIFYRSISQWTGGLGIVILMLTVLKERESIKFLKAEGRTSSGMLITKIMPSTLKIYLILTTISIALLYASGIDMFNCINLAMSGISNGGFFPFSTYEFTAIQKFILAGTMFCGATSFLFFRRLKRLQLKEAFFDEEFLLYVAVAFIAFIMIVYIGGEDFTNSILNAISAIASGGFSIGDVAIMHNFAKYILILLMLSSGMTGSTAGAIKMMRILVVLKTIYKNIRLAFLPKGSVQIAKVNSSPISDGEVIESATYIFLYMLLFLAVTGVFIAWGFGIVDSLFVVASAMGNVGLSTFTIHELGGFAKVLLMFLMYLGRIEIFPSIALMALLAGGIRK